MNYEATVFNVALLLAPLPTVYILYKYLGDIEHSDSFFLGQFGESVKFKLVGVSAAYLSVCALFVVSFAPSYFGIELANERTYWRFVVEYKREPTPNAEHFSRSGTIVLANLEGPAVRVQGQLEDDALEEQRWDAEGYFDHINFYVPINLPDVDRQTVAVGQWDNTTASASLPTFSLADELTDDAPVRGITSLTQTYPWTRIVLLSVVPLFATAFVARIGSFIGNALKLQIVPKEWLGKFEINLGGATATYCVFFAIAYVVFFGGPPQLLSKETEMGLTAARRYEGDWYYNLYHTQGERIEYTSRMHVAINNLDGIDASGRMSKLWLARDEEYNCYEGTRPDAAKMAARDDSEAEYRWKSRSAALVDDTLLINYVFVGARNENPGLLFASLLPGEKRANWRYYDFSNWSVDSWYINSGTIEVFRPGDVDYVADCQKLISAFQE